MEFIKNIFESRALRNAKQINMSAEEVAEAVFMNVLSLQAMRHDPNSMKFAADYAKKTLAYPGFDNIRTTGTDLHNWVAILNQPERYADKIGPMGRASMPTLQLKNYLRQVASGKVNPNFDKQFLMSLEQKLGVRNAQYSATRRLLSDWNRLYGSERKMGATRLLQAMRAKSARSDLRTPYETFVRKGGYELKDVHNTEKVRRGGGSWGALAAIGGGFLAGKALGRAITGGAPKGHPDDHGKVL
tara:strand:+ start:157 stop:888 length:732 start_codon:yes stop_codon:yes gene_type:complete